MSFTNIKKSIQDGIQDVVKSDEFQKTICDVIKTSLNEVASAINVEKVVKDGVENAVKEGMQKLEEGNKNLIDQVIKKIKWF